MVAFYVRMIKTGKCTLEDVNKRWYEAVKEELIKQGLYTEETNGDEATEGEQP